MAGRGPQSFKKRQREQLRKEKQTAKIEKRLQRKKGGEENPDGTDAENPESADQQDGIVAESADSSPLVN